MHLRNIAIMQLFLLRIFRVQKTIKFLIHLFVICIFVKIILFVKPKLLTSFFQNKPIHNPNRCSFFFENQTNSLKKNLFLCRLVRIFVPFYKYHLLCQILNVSQKVNEGQNMCAETLLHQQRSEVLYKHGLCDSTNYQDLHDIHLQVRKQFFISGNQLYCPTN